MIGGEESGGVTGQGEETFVEHVGDLDLARISNFYPPCLVLHTGLCLLDDLGIYRQGPV